MNEDGGKEGKKLGEKRQSNVVGRGREYGAQRR